MRAAIVNHAIQNQIAPALVALGFAPSKNSARKYVRKSPARARIELFPSPDRIEGFHFGGRVEMEVPGLAERVRTALGDLAEQLDEDWSAVVLFDALHSVGGRGGLDNWVARSERAFLSAMPRFAIQLKEWLPRVLDFGESMKCFALLGKNEVLWRSGIASTRWLPVHICVACAEVGKLEDASGSLKVMESLAEQPVRKRLLGFIRSRARKLKRP